MNGKNIAYFAAGAILVWYLLRQRKSKQVVAPTTTDAPLGKAATTALGGTPPVPPNSLSTTVTVGPSVLVPANLDKSALESSASFTGGQTIDDQLGISWKNQGTPYSSTNNFCKFMQSRRNAPKQFSGMTQQTI